MPDLSLTPASPLGGYSKEFSGISLSEAGDLSIVSLAIPLGGDQPAATAVKSAYADLPIPGRSNVSKDGKTRILGLAPDQFFLLISTSDPGVEQQVNAKLKGTVYTTDQTHVWTALEISGAGAREALERICPIDLHPKEFGIGALARTMMEHMGAIVLHTGEDAFLLLSASSSAGSFLHAVETSITNVS